MAVSLVHSLLEIPRSTLIIDVGPPMELHLMLGIVNYLFQQLQSIWPQSKEWTKRVDIQEQPYHSCHFVEIDCHKLLQNMDLLQKMVENSSAFQVLDLHIPFSHHLGYLLCFTMSKISSEERKRLWDSTVSKQLKLCIQTSNITGKDINRIHFTQITVNSFKIVLLTTIVNISERLPEENSCH